MSATHNCLWSSVMSFVHWAWSEGFKSPLLHFYRPSLFPAPSSHLTALQLTSSAFPVVQLPVFTTPIKTGSPIGFPRFTCMGDLLARLDRWATGSGFFRSDRGSSPIPITMLTEVKSTMMYGFCVVICINTPIFCGGLLFWSAQFVQSWYSESVSSFDGGSISEHNH